MFRIKKSCSLTKQLQDSSATLLYPYTISILIGKDDFGAYLTILLPAKLKDEVFARRD